MCYQQGWRHWLEEVLLSAAGWLASQVVTGEGEAEAVGGGTAEVEPWRPKGAGGEEEALLLHYFGVGQA